MKEISVDESFDLLMDTLSRLDEAKLTLNDEELACQIFEELDSEYQSFLHEWTLDRLIESSRIPVSVRAMILQLRSDIYIAMTEKNYVESYRSDPLWERIRTKAKSIGEEIKNYRQQKAISHGGTLGD